MTAEQLSERQGPQSSASLLTPAGRGAIATIRVVCGRGRTPYAANDRAEVRSHCESSLDLIDSLFRAANGLPLRQQPLNRITFGSWGTTNTEELVVCRTETTVLEIHCHGGDAAVQRILTDLAAVGCELRDWRSQAKSISGFLAAEIQEVLSRTSTWRTTQIVLEQADQLLQRAFLQLESLDRRGDETGLNQALDDLLSWAVFGLHLSAPWSVVLTGRPNVGKSSLINRLLGFERAIVFDQPGTTRDVITGETAFEGWPVVLADTAGIRRDAAELEAAGIALAEERLRGADLRIVLIDVSQPPTADDERLISQWPEAIVVAHKSDLPGQWGDRLPEAAIRVSSVTAEGVIELQNRLVKGLIPKVPSSETAMPLTTRQLELLREIRRSVKAVNRGNLIQKLIHGDPD